MVVDTVVNVFFTINDYVNRGDTIINFIEKISRTKAQTLVSRKIFLAIPLMQPLTFVIFVL